jgi:hypothetical protein
MRAKEFIFEKKRKKKKGKKAYGGYFYPGYSFSNSTDTGASDGGGGGESVNENVNGSMKQEVEKFAAWISKILNIKNPVKIELSMDTEEAQTNHHTGGHIMGSDTIWVYANNRNLVDILRTVAHELVHIRQGEIGMIKPGSSYPGSPIEAMADLIAGKYIKIYGEKNNHIFQ